MPDDRLVNLELDEWLAIEDRIPPGPTTLRVAGHPSTPTPGYKATLTKAAPQGINSKILLLDFNVTRPSKPFVPPVMVGVPVHYEERVKEGQYTQVQIKADRELLAEDELIDVEVVH
jgi:hypothetical protein